MEVTMIDKISILFSCLIARGKIAENIVTQILHDIRLWNQTPEHFFESLCRRNEQLGGSKSLDCLVAFCYEQGIGTKIDPARAFDCYTTAKQKEDYYAEYRLAYCYDIGFGTEEDKNQAVAGYRIASEKGAIALAQYRLGLCYEDGIGCRQNKPLAFHWYGRAAECGFTWAYYDVAFCYYNGEEGMKKDLRRAYIGWSKAASAGHAHSQLMVGECFELGEGIERDLHKAIRTYQASFKSGNKQAEEYVDMLFYQSRRII